MGLVVDLAEEIPLHLHVDIVLQLQIGLQEADAILLYDRDHEIKDERNESLALILRIDGDEHEVHHLRLAALERLHDRDEAKGPKLALRALQRLSDRGHGDPEADELPVRDLTHEPDEVGIDQWEEGVDELLRLCLGEHAGAIEVAVGAIEEVKDVVCILLHEALEIVYDEGLKIVSPPDEIGPLAVPLRDGVRRDDPEAEPVDVFLKPHTIHMLGVVGVIVILDEGGDLAEALDQHPLAVHVGEAQRPHQLVAGVVIGPLPYRIHQGIDHLLIVLKVKEAEAGAMLVPPLVAIVVDHPRYAPHDAVTAVGEVADVVAVLKGGVFALGEGVHVAIDEWRAVVGTPLVEPHGVLGKVTQHTLARHAYDAQLVGSRQYLSLADAEELPDPPTLPAIVHFLDTHDVSCYSWC